MDPNFAHLCTQTQAPVYTHLRTCAHAYMHTGIHAHAHTHTHTHIHTQTQNMYNLKPYFGRKVWKEDRCEEAPEFECLMVVSVSECPGFRGGAKCTFCAGMANTRDVSVRVLTSVMRDFWVNASWYQQRQNQERHTLQMEGNTCREYVTYT